MTSVEHREQNVGRSQEYDTKTPETDNHHGETCQIHLSLKSKMAAAAMLNFDKCSPDWMKIFPPTLVNRCVTAIWR